MPVLVLRDLDFGMPWVLCIEPSILEMGINVHRPDDEAVLGQIMAAAFLMWQLKIQFFTMKSLILAQDER